MPRVLLTLGDSWPQGGELKLDYEFPYGILLQKKLGFDQLHNYGSAGASNEDSLYQLQSYLKTYWTPNDKVTAVIHLTNPARTAHLPRFTSLDAYSDERKHWPADAKQFIKKFVLHFHTIEHSILYLTKNTIFVPDICIFNTRINLSFLPTTNSTVSCLQIHLLIQSLVFHKFLFLG